MSLKEKHHINDNTWFALKTFYLKSILLHSPFIMAVFVFVIMAQLDAVTSGFSWVLLLIVPWLILYITALILGRRCFVRARTAVLLRVLFVGLVLYFFGFLANAPCYRLYGTIGTFFSCLVLLLVTSIFFIRFLKEWNRLWLANDYHNTNVVIDQEKGRYDYANGFSFDEKKGSHQKGTPTYMILIYLLAPVGVGIAQILSGTGATSLLFVFIWLGGSYTFVGFNKSLAYHYFTYRKLAYFEKQTGKKIINGLL